MFSVALAATGCIFPPGLKLQVVLAHKEVLGLIALPSRAAQNLAHNRWLKHRI